MPDIDLRMQGSRFPSGSQKWQATAAREKAASTGSTTSSAPSGGNTVINSIFDRGQAMTAGYYTFSQRQQAQRFLNIIDHGLPPEMAEQLAG